MFNWTCFRYCLKKLGSLNMNHFNLSWSFSQLYCNVALHTSAAAFFALQYLKKSRIGETKNLSTDADSKIDTIFERLRDL